MHLTTLNASPDCDAPEGNKFEGVVIRIGPEGVAVALDRASSCGSCALKGSCSGGGAPVQEVIVPRTPGLLAPGDRIILTSGRHQELWASFFLLLLPVILMVSTTMVLVALGVGEALAGILGLGVAAVYFGVVKVFEPRTRKKFQFRIIGKPDALDNI